MMVKGSETMDYMKRLVLFTIVFSLLNGILFDLFNIQGSYENDILRSILILIVFYSENRKKGNFLSDQIV